MIKVIFKFENKEITLEGEPGETVLSVAQKGNLPIIAGCGGSGICGSCLVEVDPEWITKLDEPEPNEQDLLECLPAYKPTKRLACQIILNNSLNGLIIHLPSCT